MAEKLDEHVADFGSGSLDAGPYATDWMTGGSGACAQNPHCATVRDRLDPGWETGDPIATRATVLTVVEAEQPPLRVLFGRSFEATTQE